MLSRRQLQGFVRRRASLGSTGETLWFLIVGEHSRFRAHAWLVNRAVKFVDVGVNSVCRSYVRLDVMQTKTSRPDHVYREGAASKHHSIALLTFEENPERLLSAPFKQP